MPIVLIGAMLVSFLFFLVGTISAISNKKYAWIILMFFLPILGTIIYFIAKGPNENSRQKERSDRVNINPFSMILFYLFSIGGGVIALINTTIPTFCSIEFTSNCVTYLYPSFIVAGIGAIVGWLITTLFRFANRSRN